jgi:hypothetical protein
MTSPYTAVNEVRTTLRDDLIAAKALIAEPVHASLLRVSPIMMCKEAVGGDLGRGVACVLALRDAVPPGFNGVVAWAEECQPAPSDIMALFDRAIASAESSS